MKVLVIGGGGREHTIAWALKRSGHTVMVSPGNAGIASVATIVDLPSDEETVDFCREQSVDLVVIGPEAPLCRGLGDYLREAGIAVFGPGKKAAQLEASKVFSKEFFKRHNIRTAGFAVAESMEQVEAALVELKDQRLVVKADGLAAGKGVIICQSHDEVREAAAAMLQEQLFGVAGARIVVEQCIEGRECSVLAITDGKHLVTLPQAEDHKAIFDDDKGPNTGGMGTVCPASWVTDELAARIIKEFFEPTIRGLQSEGIDYKGVLYGGFMIDADGTPWILEYNCRFGDPETQVVLPRITSDVGELFRLAAEGSLGDYELSLSDQSAVCVILASRGYPTSSEKGVPILGIDDVGDNVVIFHSGTKTGDDGVLLTNGGRVLGVTGFGADYETARKRAYDAISRISFDGMQYRSDIGKRRSL